MNNEIISPGTLNTSDKQSATTPLAVGVTTHESGVVVGNFDPTQIASPVETIVSPTQNSVIPSVAQQTTSEGIPLGVSASALGYDDRPKTPLGVYVLSAFMFLSFVVSFFSNNNILYSLDMVLNLLAAIGLIARLELARKFMIIAQSISIVLFSLLIIGMVGLQARVHQLKLKSDQAISQIETSHVTPKQKAYFDTMQADIKNKEIQLGHVYKVAYVNLGIDIAIAVAMVVYLTRPKVKEVFK